MKQYKKEIDNKVVVKYRNKIVIVKDGKQFINPSEELLLADGWVAYEEPKHTEEQIAKMNFVRAKQKLRNNINAYDKSKDVNEFTISGFPVWLDKATRAGLMLRFQSEQALGKDNTTLWYNNQYFALPLSTAQAMLYQIEAYASECYDNTQRHLAEVQKLTTIEDVEAYDYKVGYPNKLIF